MIEKLKNCFDEMVVYKDLKKSNFFSALSLPSFMRDWLLSGDSRMSSAYLVRTNSLNLSVSSFHARRTGRQLRTASLRKMSGLSFLQRFL
jgi:hypothetical protein